MMNPALAAPLHPATALETRHDARQRDIVDDAISLMRVAGTLSALEYLKSHAVNAQVITRVLLEPGRRRRAEAFDAA